MLMVSQSRLENLAFHLLHDLAGKVILKHKKNARRFSSKQQSFTKKEILEMVQELDPIMKDWNPDNYPLYVELLRNNVSKILLENIKFKKYKKSWN